MTDPLQQITDKLLGTFVKTKVAGAKHQIRLQRFLVDLVNASDTCQAATVNTEQW